MTCDQVKIITEQPTNGIRESILNAYPWLQPMDVSLIASETFDKLGNCYYTHYNGNCDVYTDGAIYSTKKGRALREFTYAFILDRDEMMKISHVTLVVDGKDHKNFKDVLDPRNLAFFA